MRTKKFVDPSKSPASFPLCQPRCRNFRAIRVGPVCEQRVQNNAPGYDFGGEQGSEMVHGYLPFPPRAAALQAAQRNLPSSTRICSQLILKNPLMSVSLFMICAVFLIEFSPRLPPVLNAPHLHSLLQVCS